VYFYEGVVVVLFDFVVVVVVGNDMAAMNFISYGSTYFLMKFSLSLKLNRYIN
jgi:hypothetical protein